MQCVPGVAAKSKAVDSELNESSGGLSTETMCVCMSFTHPLTTGYKLPEIYGL